MSNLNLEQVNRGEHQLGMTLIVSLSTVCQYWNVLHSEFTIYRGEEGGKRNHVLFEICSLVIHLGYVWVGRRIKQYLGGYVVVPSVEGNYYRKIVISSK